MKAPAKIFSAARHGKPTGKHSRNGFGNIPLRALCLLSLAAAAFTGCTEPIEFDTRDTEPVLVVYGEIADTDSIHEVIISRSTSSMSDKSTFYINNAEVSLESSEGRTYRMVRKASKAGAYTNATHFWPDEGVSYTLIVKVDLHGDGNVEEFRITTDPVPPRVEFEKIELAKTPIMDMAEGYALRLWGQEPVGPNYYVYKVFINDTLLSDNITDYGVFDDTYIEGIYLEEGKGTLGMYVSRQTVDKMLEEGLMNTEQLEYLEKRGIIGPGDTVEIILANVSKNYYNFVSQVQNSRGGSNPVFGGPPANIATNVPGGAGYFTAYLTSRLSTVAIDED